MADRVNGAEPYPVVQGRCPACGNATLFLGEGGHVTCSWSVCRDPGMVDGLLADGIPEREVLRWVEMEW